MDQNDQILKNKTGLAVVFLICLAYWTYLFFSSQMVIKFDALGYEQLGEIIYEQGFRGFLRIGPTREPLYPLTIALSMHLGDWLNIHYQSIQKVIQVAILFSAQVLLWVVMTKLAIHKTIKYLVLFYFGISPAVVNSAFSLYSEILTYPAVLGIVLFGYLSWRAVHLEGYRRIMALAVGTAVSFMGAAFTKAIFQYIFIVFLIPFTVTLLGSLLVKDKKRIFSKLTYILVVVLIFGSSVLGYRSLNKKYNGAFDFTNRYDSLLFGNAAKRVEVLDTKMYIAHILSVPGGGVCRSFFDDETCLFCEFHTADKYRSRFLPEILKGVPEGEQQTKTLSLAFEEVMKNPPQYLFLTFIESLKMAFWESTQIGFVHYPEGLTRIFKNGLFKNGIRLCISFLTYLSLFFLSGAVYSNRSRMKAFDCQAGVNAQIGFMILLIIIPFTIFYAFFSILTRFAFPITSLYLIAIGLFMHGILCKLENTGSKDV